MTRWTEVVWVDILGREHVVKRLDLSDGDMIRVPRSAVTAGFDAADPEPESCLLVPDLSTMREDAFAPGRRIVVAEIRDADGSPSSLCSRTRLREAVERIESRSFLVKTAVELEFYLVDPVTRRPAYEETDCYGMPRSAQFEAILAPLRNLLPRMGMEIEASVLEYSGGQFEVNLRYSDALNAADGGVLLRLLVRRAAQRLGYGATFMAKPWTEHSGSGMHVHQSLWQDGRNAFSEQGELTDTARNYVAGLLRRMAEFSLIGSPTVNAYRRRSADSLAPTAACWGEDNRTLSARCVRGETDSATRFEQRDAAADANVYLVMAAQIAAGAEGVEEGLQPPAPVSGNAYADPALPGLPGSFPEAFDALDKSAAARRLLGGGFVEHYLAALEPDIEIFLRTCSDWERDRYMGIAPGEVAA